MNNIKNLASIQKTVIAFIANVSSVIGFLYLIFFCLLSLGQLQRTSQLSSLSSYWHEFVMFVLICLITWKHRQQVVHRIEELMDHHVLNPLSSWQRLNWKYKLFKVTVLWFALTFLFGVARSLDLLQLLTGLRLLFYIIFFKATFTWSRDVAELQWFQTFAYKKTIWALPLISIGYSWWLALLQYWFMPDVRFLRLLSWDDHYYRMVGTLFDPNFLGAILVLFIGGVLYFYERYDAQELKRLTELKKGLLVIVGAVAFSLAFTISRASYLAFCVFLVVWLLGSWWQSKRVIADIKKLAIVTGLVMLLGTGYMLAPKPGGEGVNVMRTSTVEARKVAFARQANNLNWQDLLFGQGLFYRQVNNSSLLSRGLLPDNLFMLILQGSGVVGLLLFIFWIYHATAKLYETSPALAAVLIATLVQAQFNNTLFQVFVLLYLGCILLLTYRDSQTSAVVS